MPDRRTTIVLSTLVLGMTLVAGVLLALDPGPVPRLQGATLSSLDNAFSPKTAEDKLFSFETTSHNRPWKAIVIHDSRGVAGAMADLDRAYLQLGHDDAGYHLVVNNGSGKPDGQIETSHRWVNQTPGQYLDGEGADWYHAHAIGICLIGDAEANGFTQTQLQELVWLVRSLQDRFGIPANRVYLDVGGTGQGPSSAFPYTQFQQQLR